MKTQTYSEEDLLALGYENTGMHIGNNEVWQDHDNRYIYDPESQMIVGKYFRERKELYGTGHTGSLAVGRREHK